MKYFVKVGKEIRVFDSILKEENENTYFTPRLKRKNIDDIEYYDGFLRIEDDDWVKVGENLKILEEYGLYIRPQWNSWKDSISRALGEMLIKEFNLSSVTLGMMWDYKRNRVLYGVNIDKIAKQKIEVIDNISIKINETIYYSQVKLSEIIDNIEQKTFIKFDILDISDEVKIGDSKYIGTYGDIINIPNEKELVFRDTFDTKQYNKVGRFVMPSRITRAIADTLGWNPETLTIYDTYKEYNYIEMDGNKNITYIPENRVEKYLETGNRAKYAQKTSALKMIKSVFGFSDNYITKISEELDFDITNFSSIQIISGEKIRWAYAHGGTRGTIGKSCMRGVIPEKFNIYVDNAEMVCIIENDIVKARAILWTLTNKNTGKKVKFMDRIYVEDTRTVGLFKAYADSMGWLYLENQTYGQDTASNGESLNDYFVQLKSSERLIYFPYVDTFFIKIGDRLYCHDEAQRLR